MVSKTLNLVLLVDDSNIFCFGENLQQLLEVIITEMGKLKKWLDRSKLSINLNETNKKNW